MGGCGKVGEGGARLGLREVGLLGGTRGREQYASILALLYIFSPSWRTPCLGRLVLGVLAGASVTPDM